MWIDKWIEDKWDWLRFRRMNPTWSKHLVELAHKDLLKELRKAERRIRDLEYDMFVMEFGEIGPVDSDKY